MNTQERLKSLFEGYHDVITVREAAFVVRCSKDYILDLLRKKLISYFMIGSHFRVFKEDIVIFFANTVDGQVPIDEQETA